MRYLVGFGQSDHSVEVHEHPAAVQGADGNYRVRLNDRLMDLTFRRLGPEDDQGRVPLEVHHQGRVLSCRIANARDARSDAAQTHKSSSSRAVVAQMPGRVLKVNVSAGARVLAGEPLLVIEAMKMENEVCAEVDLSVTEVRVAQGETVEAGAVLLVVL